MNGEKERERKREKERKKEREREREGGRDKMKELYSYVTYANKQICYLYNAPDFVSVNL